MKLKFKLKYIEFIEIINYTQNFVNTDFKHTLTQIDKINLYAFIYNCLKKKLQCIVNNIQPNCKKIFTIDINHFEILQKIILMKPEDKYINAILFSMQIEADKQKHINLINTLY